MAISDRATACAQQLVALYGISHPIDFMQMCGLWDVKLHDQYPLKVDGYFIRQNEDKHIFASSNIQNQHHKRFVIAHEFGHMHLHFSRAFTCCASISEASLPAGSMPSIESEANTFASELLLPSAKIRNRLHGLSIDFDLISSIANDFYASMTSTALKCVMNSWSESELLICFRNGYRQWWASSNSFWNNSTVPATSPDGSAYDACLTDYPKAVYHKHSRGVWDGFLDTTDESVIFVTNDTALVLLTGITE